ncbi:MAG: AraC family transcriptional regulator [Paenibacillaceae bacterium]
MLKVLIADDHYPVLEFLSCSIPWADLGCTLSAQCSDGMEALHHGQLEVPDILITDIGMPKMNGLELIEALKRINPFLQVIILSCHDEFHYAQKAVRLGVNDYVLKESLEADVMIGLLQQLTVEIAEQSATQDRTKKLQRIVDQSHSLIKADFIRSTLSGMNLDSEQWTSEIAEHGVDLIHQAYMPVLIYPNTFQDLKHRYRTEKLFIYAFENVVRELVDDHQDGVSFRYGKEVYILFPFPKSIKINQHEIIRGHLTGLQNALKRHMNITISAIMHEPTQSPTDLKKALQTLLNAKDQRFYAREGSIFKWVPYYTSQEDIFAIYQKTLNDFKQLIIEEREDQTKQAVGEWMQYMRDRRYSVDSVLSWLLKMVMDIEIKYSSLQHFNTKYSAELLHKEIMELESLQDIEAFITIFIQDKIRTVSEIKQQSYRTEIHEAQKYVHTHLNEKISMEEVAVMLRLNPSHFSRIYKSETGETFIEYMTRIKMEHAQEALEQSDKTIDQIAESLGYDNTSYFIKLFKLNSGYSPKEFRHRK